MPIYLIHLRLPVVTLLSLIVGVAAAERVCWHPICADDTARDRRSRIAIPVAYGAIVSSIT